MDMLLKSLSETDLGRPVGSASRNLESLCQTGEEMESYAERGKKTEKR